MLQINRRHLLVGAGSSAAVTSLTSLLAILTPFNTWAKSKTDKAVIEAWMDQWMSTTRLLDGTLHLSRFKDPTYFLLRPIAWKPNSDQASSFKEVVVPTGFVTDFASIPSIFWSRLRPDGPYAYAAIIHDYLYWTQARSRSVSDKIFRLAMQDFDIDTLTATAIYRAVRIAGSLAWHENARLKARGEKRILKQFPDDPRMSWRNWKKRPEVFVP
jgi:hypothetical protein